MYPAPVAARVQPPVVGVVEVTIPPSASVATHSAEDGQATSSRSSEEAVRLVHGPPEAGAVEVSTDPEPLTATHSAAVTQSIARVRLRPTLTRADVHGPSSGVVAVWICPEASPATHSPDVGQLTALTSMPGLTVAGFQGVAGFVVVAIV